MSISVSCPNCGKQYNVTDEAAGKRFRCKECEAVVDVPISAAQPDDGFGDDLAEPDNPFGAVDLGDPVAADTAMPRRRSSPRSSGNRSAELRRLEGPAVGMMITAGIGMLGTMGVGAMMVIALVAGAP